MRQDELDPGSAPTLLGSGSLPSTVDVALPAPSGQAFGDRYAQRSLLGEGGMGQVHQYRDELIGREVALKSMHAARGARIDAQARFLREARVQGQLEHPAIVPVYDLGASPDGAVYFTMKRIRGQTLEEIVEQLRKGDPSAARRHSRRKLLSAFSSVCLAVDFAHARGVVHRDLKPQNVMLGDFGEVYVLDWGLAKIAGAADPNSPSASSVDSLATTSSPTIHGQVMGTPGYMAPEQASGATDRIDAKSDVYALGAILFELLTWEPLHRRDSIERMLQETREGVDARASVRTPERDVPPELEAVCVRATAREPDERYPSARALQEAIERFLDGDRDLERRRALAEEHAAAGERAAQRALRGGLEERRNALREVGRAIALDPEHDGARQLLLRLLVEPPREVPPEVRAELEQGEASARRQSARQGTFAYLTLPVLTPLVLWMGVRTHALIIPLFVMLAICIGLSLVGARLARPSANLAFVSFAASCVMLGLLTPLFGPLVLVPNAVATSAVIFCADSKRRARILALACLTVALPLLLQIGGLLPPSYAFTDRGMLILPWGVAFPAWPTTIVLLVSTMVTMAIPGILIGRMRDGLDQAQERLSLQAWQLRQLVS